MAARIGREGERIPIARQIECIILHMRFLSKLRVIVLVAPARLMSPPVTSCTTTIIAHPPSCPPLPRTSYSCYRCKRLATVGGCDWVSPPPPLSLISSGVLSLPFFLTCGTPCALAFLTASLWLLPHEGADISCKLVPSVSLPRIQTSHRSTDR